MAEADSVDNAAGSALPAAAATLEVAAANGRANPPTNVVVPAFAPEEDFDRVALIGGNLIELVLNELFDGNLDEDDFAIDDFESSDEEADTRRIEEADRTGDTRRRDERDSNGKRQSNDSARLRL